MSIHVPTVEPVHLEQCAVIPVSDLFTIYELCNLRHDLSGTEIDVLERVARALKVASEQ